MALVLFGLLLFTGVLMMFAYEPSPDRAWQSVDSLQGDTLFGELIRGVHYWSANLLIPITVLHLLRVFLTGAYQGRRRANWYIGLGIIFFVLMSGFTGYLLPWDQTAYWAITICTEMLGQVPGIGPALQGIVLGGTEIGPATMINFYALHIAVTPLAMIALLTWHFWKVREAGGVVLPAIRPDDTRDDLRALPFSDLLLREGVVTAVLIAVVLVLAFFFAAPLGDPANPGISPNPAKAPWYFLGLQELLIHFDALFAVVVIPLCVIAGLIAVSFLSMDSEQPPGNWFLTPKGRRMALVASLTAIVAVPVFVLVDEFVVDSDGWLPGTTSIVSNGVIPFVLLVAGVAGYRMLLRKFFAPTRSEMVQTLFILLFVAFIVLTATGVWFRGEGMSLVWPWQM